MTATFFEKLGYLFSQPTTFYKNVTQENITPSFLMYLIVAVVTQALSFLISLTFLASLSFTGLFGMGMMDNPLLFMGGGMQPFSMLFGVIIGAGMTFAWAGFVHLFVMMFKGKGLYTDTYKVTTYAAVPAAILGLIPFLGAIVGLVYFFILAINGLKEFHHLRTGQALACVLIPFAIVFTLVITLFLIIVFMFMSAFGGGF